jgi:hypothetical protein
LPLVVLASKLIIVTIQDSDTHGLAIGPPSIALTLMMRQTVATRSRQELLAGLSGECLNDGGRLSGWITRRDESMECRLPGSHRVCLAQQSVEARPHCWVTLEEAPSSDHRAAPRIVLPSLASRPIQQPFS